MTTLYASSAASSAAYYTKYLTQAPGEVPGVWMGAQANGLGLVGNVDGEQLQALLAGLDPVTGRSLGRALTDRTTADGRVVRAVAGFDATVSAPKSLSVLWALTGDDRLLECHDVAVRAVVDAFERWAATTRVRSNGGRLHLDTQGLSVAGFRQTTSRLDDPQIHTHLVVSAKVQTQDGRWMALDARVLKQHQRTFGGLYQSVLRSEVTAKFGVGWEAIVNGQAEITGLDPELLGVFSKRAAQVDVETDARIEEFEAREGRAPSRFERAAIEREASADTRVKKTGTAAAELRSVWRKEAADLGHSPRSVIDVVNSAGRAQAEPAKTTVAEIVTALSDRKSVWHDLDVLREITDRFQPRRGIDGERWSGVLDRALDTVLEQCIGLDPDQRDGEDGRGSDGRSVWIEPVAPRWSSQQVIDQELDLLAWTLAAQGLEPSPSQSIERGHLDVLQAAAAAEVAGGDRLVVIIGPAGAGKTSMLSAAIDDLHAQGRPVFGIAPTAKAARVLEDETGMRSDTLAKLLHEHARNSGPRPEWHLKRGTTVIVDEAGMVSTPDLWRLTDLAQRLDLRVVLVGDPHQLQAVARGGMFPELSATATRTVELEHVHRFTEPWEAAASLRLRRGDPAVLSEYLWHGRVEPGTLDQHLRTIGRGWAEAQTKGRSLAITTTTNEHATLINHHIQKARLKTDAITGVPAAAADGDIYIGDVVMTRRNDRALTTTAGDAVRNRDRWTITAAHDDGSITAHSHTSDATVTLPAAYVREFVQLAYATTEHGNQGITTDQSITLVTGTTTGRGLYVGATRGRDDNQFLVVTEQYSEREAMDLLGRVLATDRADTPAVTHRRQLAERQPAPAPGLRRQADEPAWLNEWQDDVRERVPMIGGLLASMTEERPGLEQSVAQARQSYDKARALPAPDQHELSRARREAILDDAAARAARYRAGNATWRTRRTLERAATAATERAAVSASRLDELEAIYQPVTEQREAARRELAVATQRLDNHDRRTVDLRNYRADDIALDQAITTWRTWAAGHTVTGPNLDHAVEEFARYVDTVSEARALLITVTPDHAALNPPAQHLDRAEVDYVIEL
ncbi:MAG: relaxase domain-containing protein [Actinobacteria bacterium]|nr:relaxase domain-containing protein [Actinomycetota bacterium]